MKNSLESNARKVKKEGGRHFRLKKKSKRTNVAGKSEPQDKTAGTSTSIDNNTLPPSCDLLRTMEQQLRAGITPTLPDSSKARADLARSLVEEDEGAAAADVSSSIIIPGIVKCPAAAKPRPLSMPMLRRESVVGLKASNRPSEKVSKKRGRPPLDRGEVDVGVAVPGSTGKLWMVVKQWPFEEREGRGGKEGVEKPPFFKELWMMMATFGDPRGTIVCRCQGRGKKRCPCIEGIVAMEALVKPFGVRLVAICREWSNLRQFKLNHLRQAMPGEMCEFLAWKEAHSTRKNAAEKHAGVQLDDDDDDDDEMDDDAVDDPCGDPEKTNADRMGVQKQRALDGQGTDDKKSWASEEVGSGEHEWSAEEEEVAARIEHRRRFADEITLQMPEEEYLHTFSDFRRAFFMVGKRRGLKGKSTPGSRAYLAEYLGIERDCPERNDKKLLQALAYMMYDFVGVVVETAIRKRTGGRLVSISSEPMLSAREITAAGASLPPLLDRAQRVHVRSIRANNPEGISHNKPLTSFPVGLEYRGDPLRWPRNKIEKGRLLVEGGEVVDACDGKLAEEAMEILETDFADC